jgi:hypothetical protein
VQVVDMKELDNQKDKRVRVVISDGQYYGQAIINRQPELKKFCIIKILDCVKNDINNKR